MCAPRPELGAARYSARYRMRDAARWIRVVGALACLILFTSCNRQTPTDTLVMIIESSPANLDPRIGTDNQSERIGKLLYDSLIRRDEHFNLQPSLAERWETPD